MNPTVIIPVRLGSTRLARKPLADILGKPMIQHVWERACAAGVGPVTVAAAEQEVADLISGLGGHCVLTDPALPKGSDRVYAALGVVDPEQRHDVVINMQGDQPTTEPALLRRLLAPLEDPAVDVATLVVPFAGDPGDPDIVKVVLGARAGERARCLYFSRQPVPHGGPYYFHLGFYAYRRSALERFARMPRGALELSEDLEQLRLLEAGLRYEAVVTDAAPISVDTAADLARARAWMARATEVSR